MKKSPMVKIESPYPIDVSASCGNKFLEFKLLKLTERGFIADTGGAALKVASTIPECSFTLPVLNVVVSSSLRVIKNYDKPIFDNYTIQSIQRLTEFHFQKLPDNQRKGIRDFLDRVEPVAI